LEESTALEDALAAIGDEDEEAGAPPTEPSLGVAAIKPA